MTRRGLPEVKATLVDRAVSYFDPIRGAQRHKARLMLAMTGGFVGGRRDRRQTQDWTPSSGSADADLLPDLPVLRDRSRDLSRNVALAGGAINTTATNVVGTGLEPQAMIDREVLRLSDDAADAWQKQAEREWWLWAASEECDATRTQRFAELQDLVFRSVLESGDLLVLKRFIDRPGSPYGLKLQLVEADRITNPDFRADRSESGGRVISGGVEVDTDGAPFAYHVQQHPGDIRLGISGKPSWQRILAFSPKTGERVALHLFHRLRPGQTRGIPYLAPVIEPFKQLGRYTDAEIMAAVVASMFTVFVTTETGEGMTTLASDLPARSPLPGGGAPQQNLGTGLILDLAAGEKIEVANPGRPNTAFDPFITAILTQCGARLELPLEMLTKRFESSYSASRAAMLEAWKFFRSRRNWLAWSFCQPVYEAVISEAVARGRLAAPGFFEDALLRQAWCGSQWTGPPQGQIDPESEIDAAEKRMELGVSTLQEVTAELTGGDWEGKNVQREKEVRMRRAAGLEMLEAAPGAATPPPAPRESPSRTARRQGVALR